MILSTADVVDSLNPNATAEERRDWIDDLDTIEEDNGIYIDPKYLTADAVGTPLARYFKRTSDGWIEHLNPLEE